MKVRGLYAQHRAYRMAFGSGLVEDVINGEYNEAIAAFKMERYATSWDERRDETLGRFFRKYNDGYATVAQWNSAVGHYVKGTSLSGAGSNRVRERVFCSDELGKLGPRITSKRFVLLAGERSCLRAVNGRIFTYKDILARCAKFDASRLELSRKLKQQNNGKKIKPSKKPIVVSRKITTDAPWARVIRENGEAAMHAITARIEELLTPTIERHQREMHSALLQANAQAHEEILFADNELARAEYKELHRAAA